VTGLKDLKLEIYMQGVYNSWKLLEFKNPPGDPTIQYNTIFVY